MKDIVKLGGGGLLHNEYNGSPLLIVSTVYSEYEWLPWRFNKVSNRFWDNMKNQRNFMDWAEKQLNYENREDWYKITAEVMNFKLKMLKFEGYYKAHSQEFV